MAQVLQFPSRAFQPLRVHSGSKHSVHIRVNDARRPEEARWFTQFAVQRAASFRALKGFDDSAARNQNWHTFQVSRTFLIRRFLRDVESLIAAGRLDVKVDGTKVRIAASKVA